MRIVRLLYRAALLAAPAPLRRKHGRAMEEAVLREVRRARLEGGTAQGAITLAAALWDALAGGVRERWRDGSERRDSGRWEARGHGKGSEGRWNVVDVVRQDFRFAVRGLLRAPAMALMAVVTLGIGIGASTALFSVVNGVVLSSMPFPEPNRVTHLAWQREGNLRGYVPALKFEFWQRATGSFEAMTTWSEFSAQLRGDGPLEGVGGLRVSRGFFDVVGQAPIMGRGFSSQDDVIGAQDVVIVSQALWRDRLGGMPDVLDRSLVLDGRAYRILGVLPAGFSFPQAPHSTDVITPLRLRAGPTDERENYPILARLRDGASRLQADAEVRAVTATFRAEHPDLFHDTDLTMRLASYQEIYVGGLGNTLWILMSATALVLLIACANVANLLLARTMDRQDELAVRRALGASRGRVIAQLSVESGLLTILATGAGLLLARWGVDLLLALAPAELPRAAEVGIDWVVLGVALLVTAVTAAAFGVASASLLPEGGSSALSRRSSTRPAWQSRTRQALIAAEAALALVLLVGAGLLAGTLLRLTRVDAGFSTEGLVTARFPFRPDGYASREALLTFEHELLDRITVDTNVQWAAVTSSLPLERGINMPMTLASDPEVFVGDVEWRSVSPGFFETLEISILRGRAFDAGDESGAPQVVVVNESFVRQYFPDRDPIGERILIGHYNGRWIAPAFEGAGATIVGVAADISEMSLRRGAKRTMWVPRSQTQPLLLGMPVVAIRGSDPNAVTGLLRESLREIDPGLPVPELQSMTEVVGGSVAEERFNATIMGLFAIVALMLTAFGIYGVVAYGVRQRAREVGIRMALGAPRNHVVRIITLHGLAPVAVGLAAGTAASLYASRYLADLVWEISTTDPPTIAGVSLLLLAVAWAAAYIPARSAAGADPMESLTAD